MTGSQLRVLPSVAVSRFPWEINPTMIADCCGSGCVKGVGVSEGMKERDGGSEKEQRAVVFK